MLTQAAMAMYRLQLQKKIEESLASWGKPTKLHQACQYALASGGKRFRPLIVLFVAEALGSIQEVYPAALAVEFFHTASLIADDLPCMDNDDERRNKPSLHKVFGESVALLASYALITAAFEKIHENAVLIANNEVGMLALASASHCAGILGATGGQFFDLYPPDLRLETMEKVIYQKTGTLFEVSFVMGWLFGGGDVRRLAQVKQVAFHFGMAFQTADDIDDAGQDAEKGDKINMLQLLGKEGALQYFEAHMIQLVAGLRELHLWSPHFEYLCDQMNFKLNNGFLP